MAGKPTGRAGEKLAKRARAGAGEGKNGSHPDRANAGKKGKRKAKRSKVAPRPSKNPMRTAEGNFAQLVRSRRAALVAVEQPVALISQAPRSGGTLLRNLFDGHP